MGDEQQAAHQDQAEQVALPLDDGDSPIPFALTARARRAVAPETLPTLRVLREPATDPAPAAADAQAGVAGQPSFDDAVPVEPDDPHDTRPSRARALRRAGVRTDDIADELAVDELVVRAWVGEVTPVHTARRRLRPVNGRSPLAEHEVAHGRRRARFESMREDARAAAAGRLVDDVTFVRGLGLVAGLVDLSPHALVITTRRQDVAAAALRWLLATTGAQVDRLRVVLRLAPQAAADAAAHEWAEALGVPRDRITATRWRHAPDAEAVEAMIRLADPDAAGWVAGWTDALLEALDPTASGGVDAAF